jgi:hypothetical protein
MAWANTLRPLHLGITSNQGFRADYGNNHDYVEQQTDQIDVKIGTLGGHETTSSRPSTETESLRTRSEAQDDRSRNRRPVMNQSNSKPKRIIS